MGIWRLGGLGGDICCDSPMDLLWWSYDPALSDCPAIPFPDEPLRPLASRTACSWRFHQLAAGSPNPVFATVIHYINGISRHLRFGIRPISYTWSLAKSPPLAYLSYSGIEARLRAISLIVVLFSSFLLVFHLREL